MHQEIFTRWVEALESGKYDQCRTRLHIRGEGYCCLGVLSDLVAEEVDGTWSDTTDMEGGLLFQTLDSANNTLLIQEVADYTGMEHHDAEHFADLNDNGSTFEDIARIARSAYQPVTEEFHFGSL